MQVKKQQLVIGGENSLSCLTYIYTEFFSVVILLSQKQLYLKKIFFLPYLLLKLTFSKDHYIIVHVFGLYIEE